MAGIGEQLAACIQSTECIAIFRGKRDVSMQRASTATDPCLKIPYRSNNSHARREILRRRTQLLCVSNIDHADNIWRNTMLKHLLAASVIACVALAFSAAETPSAALPRPDVPHDGNVTIAAHWSGHGGFRRYRHFGRFHRRVFFVGGTVYGGGCAWLHHRALVTGSPYWWHRYRWCLGS
jgi:hypothetical protein